MKLKRSIIITTMATCLLGIPSFKMVYAESTDSKIEKEEQKLNELNEKKTASENTLVELEKKISTLSTENDVILSQKVSLEKDVNKLTVEIKELEEKINKRNNHIEEQARSTQINQENQNLIDVILDSDSLSDAIGRTVAYTKLISTSNEIMSAQKNDQENLSKKKTTVETKISETVKKADELKEKQKELEVSKDEQVKLANEILKNLKDTQSKKDAYVAEKEAAERIAQEEAQKAKEIAEQNAAAKQAAKKAAEEKNQLDSESPVSLSKGTGEQGSTDNGNTSGFQLPLSSFTVSSRFGGREDPTGSAGTFHSGIDLAAPQGTPIMASRAGNVIQSSFEPGGGNYVIIQHDNGYYTYYMHMMQPGISSGTNVSAGDVIGFVGTTGDSTGNHLHFGISTSVWGNYLDPAPFIGL